ncbi:MAG: hypothetical protein ACRCUA_03390 [Fusobacteriaceae bacterium]
MKKLLMIGVLAISAVGFAAGNGNGGRNGMGRTGNVSHFNNQTNRQGNLINLTTEQRETITKERITMDEKKLEIRKLMVTSNPDWKKVEKLNLELATLKAKSKTQMMKLRHEGIAKAQVAKTN